MIIPYREAGCDIVQAGIDSSNTNLTLVSFGGNNSKGSWTQLVASAPFEVNGCFLQYYHDQDVDMYGLLDIGIGAASSEVVLAQNYFFTTRGGRNNLLGSALYLPLKIAEGERIAVRGQCSDVNEKNYRVCLTLCSNAIMRMPMCTRCVSIGEDLTKSEGTEVPRPGSQNTKGSWVQLTSSAPFRVKYMDINWGTYDDESPNETDVFWDIGIGAAASEVVLVPNIYEGTIHSNQDQPCPKVAGPFPVNIDAGERIAVRRQYKADGSLHSQRSVIVHLFG